MSNAPQDRYDDIAGSIETYDAEDGRLVIYDTTNSLAWIAADPEDVIELTDSQEGR